MAHQNLMRRSRVTGKKHHLNLALSRMDRLSHRKFKNKKRPRVIRMKIKKSVNRVFHAHRTVTGLRVRRRVVHH
jgi:hypothetical protein